VASIVFVDAKLLAPAGSSLKSVGASIGVEKIDLPPGALDDFIKHRDGLEAWKKARRRVLKTCADLADMRAWNATRPDLRLVRELQGA
jgi:hypothetical protein